MTLELRQVGCYPPADRISCTAGPDLGGKILEPKPHSCIYSNVHWVDIEAYLSRAFGLALLAVSILTILLTGSVPLVSPVGDVDATTPSPEDESARAPYAVPTLLVTTLFQATLAFYNYTWYLANGQKALGLGMLGSAAVASLGVWCLLFATSKGHISKRTGADKRTSGFPFRNTESDKRHPERKRL